MGIFTYQSYHYRKQSNYSEIMKKADENIRKSEQNLAESKQALEKVEFKLSM